MEIIARLKTRIPFTDVDTTVPHIQYTMSSDCIFDRFSQREIYGTAEMDLVDH